MNDEKILLDMLFTANKEILKNDMKNILIDVSERNLCASLMSKMKPLIDKSKFRDYYVDVEYNRNYGDVKTIIDNEGCVIQITCDLIIHSRRENEYRDNLLTLEMKKANAPVKEKEKDKKRLKIMTRDLCNVSCMTKGTDSMHVCGYMIGVYYEIDNVEKDILFEIYFKGSCIKIFRKTFKECLEYEKQEFID